MATHARNEEDVEPSQPWLDRGYSVGSIIQVTMHNFLTYDDCVVVPGPKLNVVIGPNGTGKSALTHAICLACCGTTSDVGRSNDLSKFVKQGKESQGDCFVKVKILGEKYTFTVRRSLSADNKRSTWAINGEPTTQIEVKRRMNMMSIDVDNLCSFMPQDRVGQFSRYTPKEILQETLKSIRSGAPPPAADQPPRSLYDDQMALSNSEKAKEDRKREWDGKVHILQNINSQLEGMTADLNRLEQRQELVILKGYLDVRMVKMQADIATTQLREVEESIQNEHARIRELELEMDPLRSEVRKHKKNLAFLEKEERKLDTPASAQRLNALYQSLQEYQDRVAAHAGQLSHAATIGAVHERELARLDREREEVERQLQDAQSAPREVEVRVAELSKKLRLLQQRKHDEMGSYESLKDEQQHLMRDLERVEREYSNLRNPESNFSRLMDDLAFRMSFVRDANTAWKCVREHEAQWRQEGRLRGEWYGPVARHLLVQDPACAVMIEKAIPKNKLMGFIVLNDNDERLLRTELREKRGLRVDIYTISNLSSSRSAHYSPQALQDIHRQFQVEVKHLSEQLQCPPAVRAFLYSFLQLNTFMWCRTKQSITNELLQALCLDPMRSCRLFVHDLRDATPSAASPSCIFDYSGKRSRFDPNGRPSVVSVRCPSACFLSAADAGGQEHYRQQQQELEERRASLRAELNQVNAAFNDSEQRLRDWRTEELMIEQELQRELERQKRPARLSKALDRLREAKQQEERRLREHQESQPRQRRAYAQAIRDLCKQVHELVENVDKRATQYSRRACLQTCKRMWEEKVNALNAQMQPTQNAIQEHEMRKNALENSRMRGEADVRRFESELEQMAENFGGEHKFVHEIYPTILQRCPEKTLEEIEARRYAVMAQINGIVDNPGLVQRHQDLLEQQERLLQEEADAKARYHLVEKEMRQRSEHWYGDVQSVVDKLNFSFRESMQQLGFRGEVLLKQVGQMIDYELQLRVSFHRDSPMVDLSGTRHSGGERAVSTVMFLMALQSLTSAPFRVVDEINQGMDERNERLVMDRIVSTCCTSKGRTRVAQYFLVSPKLLHALQALDHDDVTILLVWNGPGIFNKWTIEACLDVLRKRRRAESVDDGNLIRDEKDESCGEAMSDGNSEQELTESRKRAAGTPRPKKVPRK